MQINKEYLKQCFIKHELNELPLKYIENTFSGNFCKQLAKIIIDAEPIESSYPFLKSSKFGNEVYLKVKGFPNIWQKMIFNIF